LVYSQCARKSQKRQAISYCSQCKVELAKDTLYTEHFEASSSTTTKLEWVLVGVSGSVIVACCDMPTPLRKTVGGMVV
jgi:hypothetical protein